MGFQEQLQEVLNRLPSERQTLLFSATLPKILVDFVKVGIEDPVLIRLDVDLQISENLKVVYLTKKLMYCNDCLYLSIFYFYSIILYSNLLIF